MFLEIGSKVMLFLEIWFHESAVVFGDMTLWKLIELWFYEGTFFEGDRILGIIVDTLILIIDHLKYDGI